MLTSVHFVTKDNKIVGKIMLMIQIKDPNIIGKTECTHTIVFIFILSILIVLFLKVSQ